MSEAEEEGELCHKELAPNGPALFQHGNLVFQAHHVGWIVASFFTIVACIASFWLVNKHLQWYTNKREQRFIVRILLMVPIYAVVSLASYFFWNNATPIILVRDCYESTVLTAFFYLLLVYLSPEPEEQKLIFARYGLSREADRMAKLKDEKLKTWVWPLGFIKWKPSDGLVFLQAMKWGVLQYCVLRPLTTLAAVVLDFAGLYCETSWGLGWGHVYIVIIVSLSVTVAMYCLIQLYVVVSDLLNPHRPLLKLFAIKAVVFLTFWQASFLSLLSMLGVVKDSKYMTAEDINIGIGALLQTFEMMLFAFLHIRAFSYKPYRPIYHPGSKDPPPKQTPRLRSFGHAMDFRETFRELWVGCVYLWAKMRGKVPKADAGARRVAYYENAFGRARSSFLPDSSDKKDHPQDDLRERDTSNLAFPSVRIDVEERADIGGERQWLGLGNDYGYGLHREKSESLEQQIERELERRGYGSHIPERGHIKPVPTEDVTNHKPQRSWWRSIYNRISQTGNEVQGDEEVSPGAVSKRRDKSVSRHRMEDREAQKGLLLEYDYEMDDPPPPSIIVQHRSRAGALNQHVPRRSRISETPDDILSPLPVFSDHQNSHVSRGDAYKIPHSKDRQRMDPSKSTHTKRGNSGKQQISSSRNVPGSSDNLLGPGYPSFPDADLSTEGGHRLPTTPGVPSINSHDWAIGFAGERPYGDMQMPDARQPPQSGEVVQTGLFVEDKSSPAPERLLNLAQPAMFPRSIEEREGLPIQAAQPREPRPSTPSEKYMTPPSSPIPIHDISSSAVVSPPSGLRRSSAKKIPHAYGPSRAQRHMSLPQQSFLNSGDNPLQVPQRSHPRHSLQYSARRSSRPISDLPLGSAPNAEKYYVTRDMNSNITQPTHSATADTSKHPDHTVEEIRRSQGYSRYPKLPSIPPPLDGNEFTRVPASRSQYGFVTRDSRRDHSKDLLSRSKPSYKRDSYMS